MKVSGTSQQLVDEALRETQSAAAGVQIAIRERELADAQLSEARVNLSYATITAPISGVIGSVTTQEGETVAAGLNAPTFVVIVDLDRLQVNAFVDEVDIGKVALGQRVTFNVDAFPAQDFTGAVAAIYPSATIQDNVVKYVVAIDIDDENRRPPASRDDRERAHPARDAHRARDSLARHPAGRRPLGRPCRERRVHRNPPDPHRLARRPLGRDRRRLARRRTHSVERNHHQRGASQMSRSQRIARDVFTSLLSNKQRAFLMMLGVAAGVAVLTAVIAIGQGTRERVMELVQVHNLDMIMVRAGGEVQIFAPQADRGLASLTEPDARAIEAEISDIGKVSVVQAQRGVNLVYEDRNALTRVFGVDPGFSEIRYRPVSQGEFLTDDDVASMARVAILGDKVAKTLFPEGDAVGKVIRVENDPYTVKGVFAEIGQTANGEEDQDDRLVVPFSTSSRRLLNRPYVEQIVINVPNLANIPEVAERIRTLLRGRHAIDAGEADDFFVREPDAVVDAAMETPAMLFALMAALSVVTLLAGGARDHEPDADRDLTALQGDRAQARGRRARLGHFAPVPAGIGVRGARGRCRGHRRGARVRHRSRCRGYRRKPHHVAADRDRLSSPAWPSASPSACSPRGRRPISIPATTLRGRAA